MVAVNFDTRFSLDQWRTFWKRTGAEDVVWAQDIHERTIEAFNLLALGTEIIVDRQGRMIFRFNGSAGYEKLRVEIEKAL